MSYFHRAPAALLLAGSAVLGVLAPSATSPAIAASGAPSVTAVEQAVEAAGELVEATVPATSDAAVQLPSDASGAVQISGGGNAVEIGLPGSGDAPAQDAAGGAVYTGVAPDASLLATATAEGGTQLVAVLASPQAPHSLSFPVSAGEGARLVADDDGTVDLVAPSVDAVDAAAAGAGAEAAGEAVVGEFAAPWALDATGAPVPTRYEVRGMTLLQTVTPTESTVYPITADPSFKVGWTGLFAHWSRSEAKKLAGLGLTATGAALGTLCAGPQVALCAAAAATVFQALKYVSDATVDVYYNRGYRLTSRLTPPYATYFEKR
ncbi:hypothetical protein [Nocardioides sp.]|uniref:hypothetical protein n=1 Tax=Nocardioides sp. TaxID=35761 RepID=UPI00351783AF